jgi:hypothetical protein
VVSEKARARETREEKENDKKIQQSKKKKKKVSARKQNPRWRSLQDVFLSIARTGGDG